VLDFAVNLIDQIGLLGAGLLIAIEVVILPIPSELILLLTGFNVSLGRFSFIGAIAITTLGSIAGAMLLYSLGFFFTDERLEEIVRKYGKYVGISMKDFTKTITWFERHGTQLVFFGRLIPVIRSLVSIPAGLTSMNLGKFLFFTALGSGIWNSIWITTGYFLGDNWAMAEQYAAILDYVVYSAIAVIGLLFMVKVVRGYLNYRNRRSS
jgi:membrane protein DedA with SNARE-associated domain